jgi:hypothetical protein
LFFHPIEKHINTHDFNVKLQTSNFKPQTQHSPLFFLKTP